MHPAVVYTAILALTFLLNLSESVPVLNDPMSQNQKDHKCYEESVASFYSKIFKTDPSTGEDDDAKLQKQIKLCTNPEIGSFPVESEFCRILFKLSKQICQRDLTTLVENSVVKAPVTCEKFKLLKGPFKGEAFIKSVMESPMFCTLVCKNNTILCEYFIWGNELIEAASNQSEVKKKTGKTNKSEEANPGITSSSPVAIPKTNASATKKASKQSEHEKKMEKNKEKINPVTQKTPSTTPNSTIVTTNDAKDISATNKNDKSFAPTTRTEKPIGSSTSGNSQEAKKKPENSSVDNSANQLQESSQNKGVPAPIINQQGDLAVSPVDTQPAEKGRNVVSVSDTQELDQQSRTVTPTTISEQPDRKDDKDKDDASQGEHSFGDNVGAQQEEANEGKAQKVIPPKPVEEKTSDTKTTKSAGSKKETPISKANGDSLETSQTAPATDKKKDPPQDLPATTNQGSKTVADKEVENPEEEQTQPEIDNEGLNSLETNGLNSPTGEMPTEDIKSKTTSSAPTSPVAKEGESPKVPLEMEDNKQQKDTVPSGNQLQKDPMLPGDKYLDEAEESHFFVYFLTVVTLCILGYVAFHNKQKILAMVIEGRHQRRGRRSNGGNYRRLDNNLADVMEGIKSGNSPHIIY